MHQIFSGSKLKLPYHFRRESPFYCFIINMTDKSMLNCTSLNDFYLIDEYLDATVTAYGVGLVITFLALLLMAVAQPALLYLVPCTLVPTFLIGWRRKEFRHLWTGDEVCSNRGNLLNLGKDAQDDCIFINLHREPVFKAIDYTVLGI